MIFNDYVKKINNFADNYEKSELKNDCTMISEEATQLVEEDRQ